jgi:hypothetical protein
MRKRTSGPKFAPVVQSGTSNSFSREGFAYALFGERAFKLEECIVWAVLERIYSMQPAKKNTDADDTERLARYGARSASA